MTAQLAALAVAAVAGWLIPAAVDLITKSHAPNGLKAAAAAGLAAVAGVVTTVTFTPGRWETYLVTIGLAFANAMAAHATGYSAPIQAATAGIGIGPANPAPADPLGATETAQQPAPGVITYGDGGGGG